MTDTDDCANCGHGMDVHPITYREGEDTPGSWEGTEYLCRGVTPMPHETE